MILGGGMDSTKTARSFPVVGGTILTDFQRISRLPITECEVHLFQPKADVSGMAVVVRKEDHQHSNYYYVLCGNCSATTQLYATRQDAMRAWNTKWGETEMNEPIC